MNITELLWLPEIVEKLETKHGVYIKEVKEVLGFKPMIRRGPRGKRKGENLYKAYGQTLAGRYLFIVFIYKLDRRALILSARDMDDKERRFFQRR